MLATSLVFQLGQVRASPDDIFNQAAPVIGTDPPKAAELRAGDASVSTQTGALSYTYPISVPPGRGGMAPSLALAYSSQAPIYGGIASGWSLPLGIIRRDTSRGTMAPGTDNRFMVGESRLVEVTEPKAADVFKTYRIANGDTSYTRYERLNLGAEARWRARAMDGSVTLYGEPSLITDKCTMVGDDYAPITKMTDAFGNAIVYKYAGAIGAECRISKITWGQNANAGMPNPIAQVLFTWDPAPTCAASFGNGAQRDYRNGQLIETGRSRLRTITATAFAPGMESTPDHTRTITLGYTLDDQECQSPHAPVRLLASIQESAVGIDSPLVTLPPVSFTYGTPDLDLATSSGTSTLWTPGTIAPDPFIQNLAWGYRRTDDRWPTVEAMLLDIDGDGLLDRVHNTSTPGTNGQCSAQWQRNLGPSTGQGVTLQSFGPYATITLPRLKWRGAQTPPAQSTIADTAENGLLKEGCALNGQVTAYENSVEQFSGCHPGGTCSTGTSSENPGPYCFPGGTQCMPGAGGGPNGVFRTYLAYRWLDMDNDGLVDLVTSVHGDVDRYDIDRGNMVGVTGPENTFTWPTCPTTFDRCKNVDAACVAAARSCPINGACTVNQSALAACTASANSVGCHELIRDIPPAQAPPGGGGGQSTYRTPYTRCEGLYPWFIYKNTNGVFATTPVIKYQPVPLESDTGDSNLSGKSLAAQAHAVMDFDGDGILDAVAKPRPLTGAPPLQFYVWLGDGTGGFGPTRHTFLTRTWPDNVIAGTASSAAGVVDAYGLLDVNGDGLPDHWKRTASDNVNIAMHLGRGEFQLKGDSTGWPIGYFETPTSPALAFGNESTRTVTTPLNWTGGPITAGTTTARARTVDVDQDGRVDLVRWGSPPQIYFNLGGQLNASGVAYAVPAGALGGLERLTTAEPDGLQLKWELDGDLIDLDGDGVPESVKFDPTSGFTRYVRSSPTPARLLSTVTNCSARHERADS